ncbi:MAG: GerMN domain-containing protein [Clostridia bacterium]|nr:GerMN domain-containing protein [Clostridia bacterium]
MKKALVLFLTAALLLTFAACKKNKKVNTNVDNAGDDNTEAQSTQDTISEADSSAVAYIPEDITNGKAIICRPDSEYMYFETVEVDFEGNAIALVQLMIENGALKEGIAANEYFVYGDELHINMNKAFHDYVNAGSAAEYFGVGCLVNTMIKTYSHEGIKKVLITVDGDPLIGHGGTFDEALGLFE